MTALRLWQWLAAEMPLAGDTASDVFGFISGSVPGWLLGTEVDLIESGVLPNRTYWVRRREQLRELGTDSDGND
jgi:hypothetical protein